MPRTVKRTDNWTEETFGEGWILLYRVDRLGPACSFCHVVPSIELSPLLEKPTPEEQEFIEKVPIGKTSRFRQFFYVTNSSRLACQIPVTKEMNGGIFFVRRCSSYLAPDSSPRPQRTPLEDCRQQLILDNI